MTAAGHIARWMDVDGPVHYVDFGGPDDGPLVVCVHGLGASYTSWLAFAPLLTHRARVVALDLAGFGRTPAAGRRTDVRSNRRLLAGFLAQVAGDGPVLLVGNSMGGMLGVMQAAAAPETVAGMVLVSPALPIPRRARPDADIITIFTGMVLPRVGSFALARRRRRYTPRELVEQSLARTTANPRRVPPEVVAAMVEVSAERAAMPGADAALVAATRSVVGALARPRRLSAAIDEVRAPTLLVHGQRDRLVPVAVAHQLATRRPDWRVEVLAGIGHAPQLEDPLGTARLVERWLDGPAAAAAAAPPAGPGRPARGAAPGGA
ncbi:MAG: alpha/beta hydrolase, partial [Frankia sp.]|nr:alpha/beta hydrolase [Frankia sp.]